VDWRKALPDFDERWIAHDDGTLLVVDKPPFIPSQAADPAHPDDIVTRLGLWLRSRGQPDYLGTHQRLDKDTSGLMLFVRDPKENARMAAEFENRRVGKTYLACVERWKHGAKITLTDHLIEGKERIEIGRRGKGKLAVTHVRLLERQGARALLELQLETGRTHQARVQLAHAGSPIAGDALYGGPRASRLMLHASGLRVGKLAVESAAPDAFHDWLARGDGGESVYDDASALSCRIQWAAQKRWALTRSADTDAFRLIHEDGDGLPALAVDVFGGWFVAHFFERGTLWSSERRDRVIAALESLEPDGLYVKLRAKPGSATKEIHVARGAAAPSPLVVREDGLEYLVRLDGGPAVGLYLDQRRNRTRVRHASAGKRVLNLFAYTCAFTVAAVAGGARETVSVDSSASALERGRENVLRTTGADPKAHIFACEDAAAWLARAARKNERFDLVILDPPSFGRAGSKSFSIDRDYGALVRASLAVLSPKGILLACTNHRQTSLGTLRRVLRDAASQSKRTLEQLKDLALGADFPGEPTMKSVWLRVL
jgi:23S rRNA (cytosine1962-C5)-methyltransferase